MRYKTLMAGKPLIPLKIRVFPATMRDGSDGEAVR
jgi:hypothetical protein